jgi:hypothetical protein
MMPENERIRAILTYIVMMLKSNSELTLQLSAEVAALLSAVSGLDPTFQDVLIAKRKEVDDAGAALIQQNLSKFDEILRLIESGGIV